MEYLNDIIDLFLKIEYDHSIISISPLELID